MCGASAIGDYWVLTAAHCVFDYKHTNIRIRAGSIEKQKNGTLHGVEEIMVHPNYQMFDYDGGDLDEDIAIIKLKDSLSTNPYVKYVELPFQGEPVVIGSISEVVGWGLTKTMFEGEATFLQKAKAEIVNVEDCEENPMLTGRFVVSDNMICAMGEQQTGYKQPAVSFSRARSTAATSVRDLHLT
uniref:Peptidase S1 domain-containing protein n=1 Tax=Timema poppense TaxID=170557 RepID=A0A7R9DFM7_TIMPO|nr:unnamed protein product [Timema poppensis]